MTFGFVGSIWCSQYSPPMPPSLANETGCRFVSPVVQIDDAAVAAVVLDGTDDVERRVHVSGDVEERARRQLGALPVRTGVGRDAEAAVVAADDELRILRIDPQRVVVSARTAAACAPPPAPAPPAPATPAGGAGAGRNAPNVLPPSADDTAWNDSRYTWFSSVGSTRMLPKTHAYVAPTPFMNVRCASSWPLTSRQVAPLSSDR